jgi:predicted RND superfamily exporter protein
MTSFFGRILDVLFDGLARLARVSYRRPWIVLGLVALASGVAFYGTKRVVLDTDVTTLLPERFPSVHALDTLRERFGGVGFVTLVARGDDPQALERFADDVTPLLRELDTVASVDARRPIEFFDEHALYWVERGDLETIAERLEARHEWEVASRNPLMVLLEDEGPPPVDFADVEAKYRDRLADARSAYYTDHEGQRLVVLVRPTKLATDLTFTRQVVDDVERVSRSLDPRAYGPGFSVEITGRYKKRADLQALIQNDLAMTGIAATILMGVYLLVHFRRISAIPLVLLPLAISILWMYGLAGFLFGTLSLLTAFIGTLLTGVGIDSGIHLAGAHREALGHGHRGEAAIYYAFRSKSRAAVAATLTTMAAFLCIATAELRAFREFGIIAASGMLLSMIAYYTLLPALLRIFARRSWANERPPPPIPSRVLAWAPAAFWIVALAAIALSLVAPHARFNYDFADLDAADLRSYDLDREVNEILGRSQTPLVIAGTDAADVASTVEAIERDKARLGRRSTVADVVWLGTFVAPDQEAKRAVLDRIDDVGTRLLRGEMSAESRADLERLVERSRARPYTTGELPPEILHTFRPPRAGGGELALVYPSVSMSDGTASERLAEELGRIERADGTVVAAAGEAMVLADVIVSVRRDSLRVSALVLGAVGVLLWATLGTIRRALVALAPAVLSVTATLGVMAIFDVDLNYLNLLVFPLLVGSGVDGGAYVVSRWVGGEPIADVLGATWAPVAGAIVNTMLGFFALMLASHPGLASVGIVGVVGFSVNLVACVILVPAAVALAGKKAERPSLFDRLAELVSTVGRAGVIPRGGGSVAALAAIPIAWSVSSLPIAARVAIAIALSIGSLVFVRRYMRGGAIADPQEIVVDELVGCLIALAFVPFEPVWVVAAYVAFRVLDIAKPWPIRAVERRLHGPLGVVADDVAAGLVAGGALAIVHLWW